MLLQFEGGKVDDRYTVVMDIIVAAAVRDVELSAEDGEPLGLIAHLHGGSRIAVPVDAVHLPGNGVGASVNGTGIGGYINIAPLGQQVPGAFHIHHLLQFGIRQMQDNHLVGGVEGHPQFAVRDQHVVGRVAEPLHDLGIGLCKDVGAIFPVLEVQQVQGRCPRIRALVEDIQLGEAAIVFTYFVDFDTRE